MFNLSSHLKRRKIKIIIKKMWRKKLTFWLTSDNCLSIFPRSSPSASPFSSWTNFHPRVPEWGHMQNEYFTHNIIIIMLNPLRDVKNALICSSREVSLKALQNITFCLLSHPNDVYIAGILSDVLCCSPLSRVSNASPAIQQSPQSSTFIHSTFALRSYWMQIHFSCGYFLWFKKRRKSINFLKVNC